MTPKTTQPLCFVLLLVVTTNLIAANALSSTIPKVPGSPWASPINRKKIAVMGGGSLGGWTFGYLQRACSLFGTGLGSTGGPINSPCCFGATAITSTELNKILGSRFGLAYAGEDQVKLSPLVDWRGMEKENDSSAIEKAVPSLTRKLRGFNGVVLGTECVLEQRPITTNTYGKTPNDRTLEAFFDKPRQSLRQNDIATAKSITNLYSLEMFQNILTACQKAGTVQHVLVVETPKSSPQQYLDCLHKMQEEGDTMISYTYLQLDGPLTNCPNVGHSYLDGVVSNLVLDLVDSSDKAKAFVSPDSNTPINREDLAALLCQALQSLDWGKNHIIRVGCKGPLPPKNKGVGTKNPMDGQWCLGSDFLAERLSFIQ